MSNLLNSVSHFGFTILLKKWEKGKTRRCLSEEKTEEKQNLASKMISVEWKGTIFVVKLKLQKK